MKYYFCKDSEEIITESFLREQFERDNDGFDSYEDFVNRLTDPWECLTEIHGITEYYRTLYWMD